MRNTRNNIHERGTELVIVIDYVWSGNPMAQLHGYIVSNLVPRLGRWDWVCWVSWPSHMHLLFLGSWVQSVLTFYGSFGVITAKFMRAVLLAIITAASLLCLRDRMSANQRSNFSGSNLIDLIRNIIPIHTIGGKSRCLIYTLRRKLSCQKRGDLRSRWATKVNVWIMLRWKSFCFDEKGVGVRQRLRTRAQAKIAIFVYIEPFYSRQRRHSSIGDQTPQQEFKARAWKVGTLGTWVKLCGKRDEVQSTNC